MDAFELKRKIKEETENVQSMYAQIIEKERFIQNLNKELEMVEEQELMVFIDNWLKNHFGIKNQEEARENMYIVFDNKGNFMKTVTCGYNKDFHYVSPSSDKETLEHWLKKNKLYAHCASSFCNRNRDWYNQSFVKQLENLGWDFNRSGVVVAAW